MQLWATHVPTNYQNKYDLVEAEKARLRGEYFQAEQYYDQATHGAKKANFIAEEALAYEKAGEFYLTLGREEIGQFYLKNAYHSYNRWGAKAKIRQLEEKYASYLVTTSNSESLLKLDPRTSLTGENGEILTYWLLIV